MRCVRDKKGLEALKVLKFGRQAVNYFNVSVSRECSEGHILTTRCASNVVGELRSL